VCCSCAEVPTQPLPRTRRETGSDGGVRVFLVTAEGQGVTNPRHSRTAQQRLTKAQRRIARRKQGSQCRKKAVQRLARQHQQGRRHRTEFPHKTALRLLRRDDGISREDLQVRSMSRRPAPHPQPDGSGGYLHNGASAKAGRNTSSNDAGWYAFHIILTCTAAGAGKRVEAVPPAYTSQDCSGCGERVRKSLSVRESECADACLPPLRVAARPRRARGAEYPRGRAGPSGTRGGACGHAPRTRRPVGRAECQKAIRFTSVR
jgi:putative transposase